MWVGIGALVLGLVFLAMGARALADQARRRRDWVRLPGVVVGSRLDGDGHVQLHVEYDGAAGPVRFWNPFTASGGMHPEGQAVEVLANPKDPTDAIVVAGGPSPILVGVLFSLFGCVALVTGVVFFVLSRSGG